MKKLAFMILVGFAAFSCTKEPVTPDNGQSGVTVQFTVPEFNEVNTRATNESGILDIWVLQYKDGALVPGSVQLLNPEYITQVQRLEGLVNIPTATNAADSTKNVVVFLANLRAAGVPEAQSVAQMQTLTTFASLQNLRVNVDQRTTLGTVLPMTGYYYDGISIEATNQLNIRFERLVAKINFTLNPDNFKLADGTTPAKFGVTSMKLCKTPKQLGVVKNHYQPKLPVGLANGVLPEGFTPYPDRILTNFGDITDNLSVTGSRNFTAYVAENARGSYPLISNNGQKIPANVGVQGDYLTYIEVTGQYVENNVLKQATYKIYLGGNATGDMNLLANTTYNVTTYLYGANTSDTRIGVTAILDQATITNFLQPANSYMINATGVAKTYTISLATLAEGWATINSTITDPAQKSDIADLLSNDANWSAETLWKDWSGNISTSVTAGVAGLASPKYMSITVPATVTNGHNCVIALYDRRPTSPTYNKIMWSWHLWFTDYAPTLGSTATNGKVEQYISKAFQTGGLHAGKYMMDRNLGATITSATLVNGTNIAATMATPTGAAGSATATTTNATALRGMMYQWGRKDVFTPTTEITNTDLPAMSSSTILYDKNGTALTEQNSTTIAPNQGVYSLTQTNITDAGITNNVLYAVQNPLHFLANGGDWTGLGSGANDYWGASGATKGAFDPCPAGWRTPRLDANPLNNPFTGLNNQTDLNATIVNGGVGSFFPWFVNGVMNTTGTTPSAYPRTTGGRLVRNDATTPTAWYPASGYRTSASGAFNNVGSNGYNWGRSVTGTSGYGLDFNATTVYPAYNNSRALGFPIRCIQE